MKKLIIFDMDGTLVDSSDMIVNSINHIREYLSLDILSKEVILQNINDPKIYANQFFYNNTYFDEEMTNKFNKYYEKNCIVDLKLFPYTKQLLKDLSSKHKLVIATNTPTNLANKMLEHLGIKDYFTLIVGSDIVKTSKPNPDILLYIIQKFDIKKKDVLFIGDSQKDKLCAKNAHIDFMLINEENIKKLTSVT
jgi:phosphoglycolate phosphatase